MAKLKLTDIINNLIDTTPPNIKGFWGKESKLLKALIETYPDESFWKEFSLEEKIESIAQLYAYPFDEILRQRYRNFHLTLPKDEEIELSTRKSGKNTKRNKNLTLRDFING